MRRGFDADGEPQHTRFCREISFVAIYTLLGVPMLAQGCVVAVKYSVGTCAKNQANTLIDLFQVESSVESLISRYEVHFDRHQQ